MLRVAASVRAAARDFGRLPELPDAQRLLKAGELHGALNQLQRAAEVVGSVPMPALQAVAAGVLASGLRATGQVSREAAVWEAALGHCGIDSPDARLHVLHGLATCSLHSGDGEAARQWCDEASGLTAVDAQWAPAFASHRSLGRFIATPSAELAVAQLREDVLALEVEGGETSDAVAAAAHLAASEGVRLILGDALARTGSHEAARECWTALAALADDADLDASADQRSKSATLASEEGPPPTASEHASAMREVVARCRIGASMRDGGDVPGARAHLTAALDACEARLPLSHPLMGHALGHLAAALAADGEFVTAEGLYRTAIDSLPPVATAGLGASAQVVPLAQAQLALSTLSDFATLLDRLETNGRPRAAEAEQLRARASALRAEYPELLQEGRRWQGLEPWYAAASEVDWMGACLAPAE